MPVTPAAASILLLCLSSTLQLLAFVLPAAEYFPASHSAQKEAPTAAEYLLAGHDVHTIVFVGEVEYLPAAQPTHAADSALQVQLLRLVLPAGEEEPSGHEMQFPVSDERDGPSLYVSAGQRVQGPNGSIWQRNGRD